MDIELTQGEEKTITFTYADSLDVSSATMSFAAKTDLDASAAAFSKSHDDFDMTDAATGIVTFDVDSTDTANAGTFLAELKATFSETSLDISSRLTIWIKEAVA